MGRHVPNETILQARKIRDEKGYSYNYILDKSSERGNYTSLSTIRRFFNDDITKHHFSYQAAQGILDVVFDVGSKTEGQVAPETLDVFKDSIKELHRQLDEERAAHQEALRMQKELYESQIAKINEQIAEVVNQNRNKIDFIKDELEKTNAQIRMKDDRIDRLFSLLELARGLKTSE